MARKEKSFHYIYKTTCIKTNKYYIGLHSTNNLEDGYLGSGKRLAYSLRKHGRESHVKEILEFVNDRESLAKREAEIVNEEMLKEHLCMNIVVGGGFGFSTDERTKHLSEKGNLAFKNRLANDTEFRDSFCNEISERALKNWQDPAYREKLIKTRFGKYPSDETKQKIRETQLGHTRQSGEKNSSFGSCWITNELENKKVNKEELDYWVSNGWRRGYNSSLFKR